MSSLPVESQSSSSSSSSTRFSNLRGIRWRIDLGILPSSPSASIDQLRRVTAESRRRRYAILRRRLLIDPHLPKDGSKSPDLTMDNPLSQNPESTWGRFFRNAELEKVVDQDLSRLYPEHESYFHTHACQALLRRVLLLWCLRHPEYGYRQGMHELLAPLLYVLHIDLQYLFQIRALYEDCFSDEFDEMSFSEGDLTSNYWFTKSSRLDSRVEKDSFDEQQNPKITSFDDLDPETKQLFLLSDAYGAEGELGVILSERFMEHDAYCMFDGLMSGARGVVAMADFFSPSPIVGSSVGIPPVIEASAALYHLLSVVDSSLHTHLIDLGVEPQYFALRWLRVLFGREFSLDNLLLIWDELFASSNTSLIKDDLEWSFKVLCCPRGAFISAMAVSMLIHLRSALLATENATSCLQRLLNFPKNIDVRKLIEKAKSWQALAFQSNIISSSFFQNSLKPEVNRIHSRPTDAASPKTPNQLLHDSYWEEKWRVLHKEGAAPKNSGGKIRKLLGDRFGLLRTESDPLQAKKDVRRRLFNDLTDVKIKLATNGVPEYINRNETLPLEADRETCVTEDSVDQTSTGRNSDCTVEETCLSGEHSSVFSMANSNSPHNIGNDHENDLEKSSVSSNSPSIDNDEEAHRVEDIENVETGSTISNDAAIINEDRSNKDDETKYGEGLKDRKLLFGRFQWLLRFGRGPGEGNSEKQSSNDENVIKENPGSLSSDCNSTRDGGRAEVGDKKVMGTLKNLGQSMLENIQMIESVFQQEQGQAGNILGGKGQATAVNALKELRKISNLLSEM